MCLGAATINTQSKTKCKINVFGALLKCEMPFGKSIYIKLGAQNIINEFNVGFIGFVKMARESNLFMSDIIQ